MEICTSLDGYNALRTIKKEPNDSDAYGSSNCFGDSRQHLNPKTNYYKKELDLSWDEKDNNYDVNCENSANEAVEKSVHKDANKNKTIFIGQEKKRTLKTKNPDIDDGEVCENLVFQKYHYKEEINLDWDEKDNNHINEAIEECSDKDANMNETTLICQEKKRIVKIENPDIDKGEICENFDLQKYHYKEELSLDWDERDNNYNVNHPTEKSNQKPIEQETNSTSILQSKSKNARSKKKKLEIENPDTEKDCPKCKKRLKNLNTLKKHIYYCGKEPHLQCDSCSYKANYKNSLIVHIMRNHPQQISNPKKKKTTRIKRNKNEKVLKERQLRDNCFKFCADCNISTDKSKINTCRKCKSQLLYQCQKCKELFQTREKLTRHIIDKCDPKGYYHCPACDFKSTIRQDVKFHLKRIHLVPGTHLDVEDIKWKKIEGKDDSHLLTCPNCNKLFQRKASLGNHMRFCIKSQGVTKPPIHYVEKKKDPGHTLMIMKYCAKCNKSHPVVTRPTKTSECCGSSWLFKCLKCDRRYKSLPSIYAHVINICNLQTKYKCDKCDYEGSKLNLHRHQEHTHYLDSIECPNCKQQVRNQSTLRLHLVLCGKERLKCDHCPYTSKRRYLLNLHILRKHPK